MATSQARPQRYWIALAAIAVLLPIAACQSSTPTSNKDIGSYLGPPIINHAAAARRHNRMTCSLLEYPVGIYLGPSYLTSSHYNASHHPITIAKVEASREWREWVAQIAGDQRQCCQTEEDDMDIGFCWGPDCHEIVPAFVEAVHRIVNATAVKLGRPVVIGALVLPQNFTRSCYLCSMGGVIADYDPEIASPDPLVYGFLEHRIAAQHGYSVADPSALISPFARFDLPAWEDFPSDTSDITSAEGHVLVVNFERDFLELTFSRMVEHWSDIDSRPLASIALLEQGEESFLATRSGWDVESGAPGSPEAYHDNMVSSLTRAIKDFLDDKAFEGKYDNIRAVILTGGASPVGMDAAAKAMKQALPWPINDSRFKASIDPAFVLSLGAAFHNRNERFSVL